jgi:hypothetical protein
MTLGCGEKGDLPLKIGVLGPWSGVLCEGIRKEKKKPGFERFAGWHNTLACGFVLSISNIFLQFMSTGGDYPAQGIRAKEICYMTLGRVGGDTKHHPKYYQKPHLCLRDGVPISLLP